MKIVTWNVNGFRAAWRKGMWDWVRGEAPDVLCLQEVRMRLEQLPPEAEEVISAENVVWNPAERAGYSGVATFYRKNPRCTATGLGEKRFDREGRVIRLEYPEFVLFNIYFPNGKRDHSRVGFKLDFYKTLLAEVDRLHSGGVGVILCGDFNTAHREIDLRHPRANRNTTGFLHEERAWIDRYLEHDLVDIYRLRYPEREQYTWWTYRLNARSRNVGWRLDYYLVSSWLEPRVVDTVIHDQVAGSDHCPVSLLIEG